MKKNVLSLFDGLSGFQLALRRSGIKIDRYYSSEINEQSMMITNHHFPNTIQLGDIRNITASSLPKIWCITAGSPCTNFSFAGKRNGMVTSENIEVTTLEQYLSLKNDGFQFEGQSYLFWEFIRLLRELKPKYFLLENVAMSPKWKYIISKETGVLPLEINSSLVSAQNRNRLYWTNFPDVSQPKDKGIKLEQVIPMAKTGYGIRGADLGARTTSGQIVWQRKGTARQDFKANCLTTARTGTAQIALKNGHVRKLTVSEAEQLQTLPKNYTKVKNLTDNQRWHAIGNGWTISVISHLLRELKKECRDR